MRLLLAVVLAVGLMPLPAFSGASQALAGESLTAGQASGLSAQGDEAAYNGTLSPTKEGNGTATVMVDKLKVAAGDEVTITVTATLDESKTLNTGKASTYKLTNCAGLFEKIAYDEASSVNVSSVTTEVPSGTSKVATCSFTPTQGTFTIVLKCTINRELESGTTFSVPNTFTVQLSPSGTAIWTTKANTTAPSMSFAITDSTLKDAPSVSPDADVQAGEMAAWTCEDQSWLSAITGVKRYDASKRAYSIEVAPYDAKDGQLRIPTADLVGGQSYSFQVSATGYNDAYVTQLVKPLTRYKTDVLTVNGSVGYGGMYTVDRDARTFSFAADGDASHSYVIDKVLVDDADVTASARENFADNGASYTWNVSALGDTATGEHAIAVDYAPALSIGKYDGGVIVVERGGRALSDGDAVHDGDVLDITLKPAEEYGLAGSVLLTSVEEQDGAYVVRVAEGDPTPVVEALFAPLGSYPATDENGCFLVYTADELAWCSANALRGDIRLMADINVDEAEGWAPFGVAGHYKASILDNENWVDAQPFMGRFDGNGHTVSGVVSDGFAGGLFACAGAGAVIENVTVQGSVLTGSTAAMHSSLGDDKMYGYISAAGGIVGVSYGCTVRNCVNKALIEPAEYEGASANISEFALGGVVGAAQGGTTTVAGCVNAAQLGGNYKGSAGGMVGEAKKDAKVVVEECLNTGSLQTVARPGGIVGLVSKGSDVSVSCCANIGSVAGEQSGGIVGQVDAATVAVDSCRNAGAISGNTGSGQPYGMAAGIVARLNDAGSVTVTNCYNAGTTSGKRESRWNSAQNVSVSDSSDYKYDQIVGYKEGGDQTGSITVENCYYLKDNTSAAKNGTAATADFMRSALFTAALNGDAAEGAGAFADDCGGYPVLAFEGGKAHVAGEAAEEADDDGYIHSVVHCAECGAALSSELVGQQVAVTDADGQQAAVTAVGDVLADVADGETVELAVTAENAPTTAPAAEGDLKDAYDAAIGGAEPDAVFKVELTRKKQGEADEAIETFAGALSLALPVGASRAGMKAKVVQLHSEEGQLAEVIVHDTAADGRALVVGADGMVNISLDGKLSELVVMTELNFNALEGALGFVQDALDATAVSADGANVAADAQWTTAAERDKLVTAAARAASVLGDDAAAQSDVDAAADALADALEAFQSAAQAGTGADAKALADAQAAQAAAEKDAADQKAAKEAADAQAADAQAAQAAAEKDAAEQKAIVADLTEKLKAAQARPRLRPCSRPP